MREKIISYLEFSIMEMLYFVFASIFLYKLFKLNQSLASISENAFEVLTYNDSIAVYYFIFTIVFIAIGVFAIRHRFNQLQNHDLEELEAIYVVVNILLLIVLIIIEIVFINNPILRAIMIALLAIGGFGSMMYSN